MIQQQKKLENSLPVCIYLLNGKSIFIPAGFAHGFVGLKKENIVKSVRGTRGGYILSKEPEKIKLANILKAVDEEVKTIQCKKESKRGCNGKATKCITHDLWDELENHINSFFEKKSLEKLKKINLIVF